MRGKGWFWLVAGPNGAGKTTLSKARFSHVRVINPDAVAQRLSPDRPADAAVAAGRASFEAVRIALRGRHSFAVETTLAGRSHLRLLGVARREGWNVGLAFVGIETAEDAIGRVLERYRRGGHSVPPVDIRRRYARSMAHLPVAARLADFAVIYDNSLESGLRRTLEIHAGRIAEVTPPSPTWLVTALAPVELKAGARLGAPGAPD